MAAVGLLNNPGFIGGLNPWKIYVGDIPDPLESSLDISDRKVIRRGLNSVGWYQKDPNGVITNKPVVVIDAVCEGRFGHAAVYQGEPASGGLPGSSEGSVIAPLTNFGTNVPLTSENRFKANFYGNWNLVPGSWVIFGWAIYVAWPTIVGPSSNPVIGMECGLLYFLSEGLSVGQSRSQLPTSWKGWAGLGWYVGANGGVPSQGTAYLANDDFNPTLIAHLNGLGLPVDTARLIGAKLVIEAGGVPEVAGVTRAHTQFVITDASWDYVGTSPPPPPPGGNGVGGGGGMARQF